MQRRYGTATGVDLRAFNSATGRNLVLETPLQQREALDRLKSQLSREATAYDSLYKLSSGHLTIAGAGSLLQLFLPTAASPYSADSIPSIVSTIYPEHSWSLWQFEGLNLARSPAPNSPATFWARWWTDILVAWKYNDPVAECVLREYKQAAELAQGAGATLTMAQVVDHIRAHFTGPDAESRSISERAADRRALLAGAVSATQDDDVSIQAALYRLTNQQIREIAAGSTLLHLYEMGGSAAVMTEFPEFAWRPWEFNKSPKLWWHALAQEYARASPVAETILREFVEMRISQAKATGAQIYPTLADDYNLKYFGSPREMMQRLGLAKESSGGRQRPTPSAKASFDLNAVKQASFWKAKDNRLAYFEYLKERLGGKLEDFYSIENSDVLQTGGFQFVDLRYNGSIVMAVMDAYPTHLWRPWKFYRRSPRGWWIELADRFAKGDIEAETTLREFVEDLAQEVGVESLDGWLTLASQPKSANLDLVSAQLRRFGGLDTVLKRIYLQHAWPAQFGTGMKALLSSNAKSVGYWNSQKNRRTFMDGILKHEQKDERHFFDLTAQQLIALGGSGLAQLYSSSIVTLVSNLYPEFVTPAYRFENVPMGFWSAVAKDFRKGSDVAIAFVWGYLEYLDGLWQVEKRQIQGGDLSVLREGLFTRRRVQDTLKELGGVEFIARIFGISQQDEKIDEGEQNSDPTGQVSFLEEMLRLGQIRVNTRSAPKVQQNSLNTFVDDII